MRRVKSMLFLKYHIRSCNYTYVIQFSLFTCRLNSEELIKTSNNNNNNNNNNNIHYSKNYSTTVNYVRKALSYTMRNLVYYRVNNLGNFKFYILYAFMLSLYKRHV